MTAAWLLRSCQKILCASRWPGTLAEKQSPQVSLLPPFVLLRLEAGAWLMGLWLRGPRPIVDAGAPVFSTAAGLLSQAAAR